VKTMRRSGILVGFLAVLLLAVLCALLFLRPWDPLEIARRRIRPGMDEEAVTAVVGRAGESAIGQKGPEGIRSGRTLYWRHGADILFVSFDGDGRAVRATIGTLSRPTLWQRVRSWWPW
jgi:hypothetical protein